VGLDVEMAQQLASDLGVGIQFVRFDQVELPVQVRRRTVDIVMTGARLTPERSAEFVTSEPYLDETLAIVAPDHTRQQFRSWEAIRSLGPVRLGVQNLPYYIGAVRSLMPDADLTVIAETTELIQPESGLAAYVLPAERGSVLTMLNPQFTVVVPEGARVLMPLAYPIAGHAGLGAIRRHLDSAEAEGRVRRRVVRAVDSRPRGSLAAAPMVHYSRRAGVDRLS
jgi:hypothetical protein